MASSVSHRYSYNNFLTHSLHHSSHNFSSSVFTHRNLRNRKVSVRFIRTTVKSSLNKVPGVKQDKSAHDSESRPESSSSSDSGVNNPDPDPPLRLSLWNSASPILERFKVDGLVREILSVALPAALALASDPIASLIDTAFVGHLGSIELAAVGVSASVFNLVSKLFNIPLLNVTTSFVAEEQALLKTDGGASQHGKIILPSISTSLALAAGLGLAEAIAVSVGSSFLMDTMGITADSPMRTPAEQFLTMRAFGAPAVVIALATQGTFRGFKDTKTPLYAVGKYR
ncbi:unnamed protein product [Cuscuta epithymum]|uniref:Uncharacterized protein n=1 Tax=Cuscuta epithymum TaxID=186058 RepID=A0AAV0G4B2_9ASTE|nr:unnamed protein product [Cuscuta epithymum]CAH9142065.1 unnamed protein product [Cuscuta epithymum]